ncbi:unnamed protein product [Clavelina lepadiformis]|uniref:Uncharacterized protein n=1 Tax=Clavelina lepadiformis TaxID=159417 RepID=A0ABP0GMX0_CLALP
MKLIFICVNLWLIQLSVGAAIERNEQNTSSLIALKQQDHDASEFPTPNVDKILQANTSNQEIDDVIEKNMANYDITQDVRPVADQYEDKLPNLSNENKPSLETHKTDISVGSDNVKLEETVADDVTADNITTNDEVKNTILDAKLEHSDTQNNDVDVSSTTNEPEKMKVSSAVEIIPDRSKLSDQDPAHEDQEAWKESELDLVGNNIHNNIEDVDIFRPLNTGEKYVKPVRNAEENSLVRDVLATLFVVVCIVLFVILMRRMIWKSVISLRFCGAKKRKHSGFEYRYGKLLS